MHIITIKRTRVIKIENPEWTTTRMKRKELEDLHQLKRLLEVAMDKKLTLGASITEALKLARQQFSSDEFVDLLVEKVLRRLGEKLSIK